MRVSPSSEELNSAYFLSGATAALIMKASMLMRTPDFSFSLLSCLRNTSSSVMSHSSWLVTCGIITQLRCNVGPEIFLMRESGFVSMGPNLAKSTLGQGNRPGPVPCVDGLGVG